MGVADVLGAASGLFGGGAGFSDTGLNDGRQVLDQKLATGAFAVGSGARASQEPVFSGSASPQGVAIGGGSSGLFWIVAGAAAFFLVKGK